MISRFGKIIIALGLGVLLYTGYESLTQMSEQARRASCRPNLILHFGNEYADANEGVLPPLSPVPGMLFPDSKILQERGISQSDLLCEFDLQGNDRAFEEVMRRNPLNDWSYVYLGYFIENDEQLLAFAEVYVQTMSQGGNFEADLKVAANKGSDGGNLLRRMQSLKSLQERSDPLAERASDIPVVIEWPENHRAPGGHVVYLDGHREYVPYPGKFPMTETAISTLRALDNYAPTLIRLPPENTP